MGRKPTDRPGGTTVTAPTALLRDQVIRLRALAHADYRVREAGPQMLIVLRSVARYFGYPTRDAAEYAFEHSAADSRTRQRAGLAIAVLSAIDTAERGTNYGP
jgi:hypothetical protein